MHSPIYASRSVYFSDCNSAIDVVKAEVKFCTLLFVFELLVQQ